MRYTQLHDDLSHFNRLAGVVLERPPRVRGLRVRFPTGSYQRLSITTDPYNPKSHFNIMIIVHYSLDACLTIRHSYLRTFCKRALIIQLSNKYEL